MKKKRRFGIVEIKKANILHHDVEAEIFERVHPEGSSLYEKSQVLKSIYLIDGNSTCNELCVDVGCGSGFLTGFELPLYSTVVATDISRRMLEVARKRLGHFSSLDLLVCDAEFLPLRNEIADLVSVSSVLHHLPRPFSSITEISRVLKRSGILYVTREPNVHRLRRFFDFFDQVIVRKLMNLIRRPPLSRSAHARGINIIGEGLDYSKVDVHYPTGFHVAQLAKFLNSKSFEVVSAYSYHWIYPNTGRGIFREVLSKSNFIIAKIPFSKKLGRYVCLVAKKLE